ncbi:MAG TPA: hypothetical protein VI837_09780 [Blastocatellia bacterium]|nr:hypothetical protein [Blastocatellia bacterium]
MKVWKNKLVTILFALAGVLFLVPTVKSVIKGQPLNVAFLGVGVLSLVLAIATWRKSGKGSGPPSA